MYFVHSHVSPDRAWNESYIDSYPIRIRFLLDGANHTFDTRPNRIRSSYDYHVLETCYSYESRRTTRELRSSR